MPDFLQVEDDAPKGSLHDLTLSVACGRTDKAGIASFLRSHAHPAP